MKVRFLLVFILQWFSAINLAHAQTPPVVENKNVEITRDSELYMMLPFQNGGPSPTCKVAGDTTYGTVIISSTCEARYRPNPGYLGKDKFGFRVFNGKIKSLDVGTIFISIINNSATSTPTHTTTPTRTITRTITPTNTPTITPTVPIADFTGNSESLLPYRTRLSQTETNRLFKHTAFGGGKD